MGYALGYYAAELCIDRGFRYCLLYPVCIQCVPNCLTIVVVVNDRPLWLLLMSLIPPLLPQENIVMNKDLSMSATKGLHKSPPQIMHGNWWIQTASLALMLGLNCVSTNKRSTLHQKQGLTTMQSVKSFIMSEQGKLHLCMIHTNISQNKHLPVFPCTIFPFNWVPNDHKATQLDYRTFTLSICDLRKVTSCQNNKETYLCIMHTKYKQNKSLPVFLCTNSSDIQTDPAAVTIW